ncbi:MAG: OMF family outer membrane protein [Chlorobi bacterium OLB7]|nr:MAG: OMF family outer membrane protein [Chlorobi bacterium OLB7]
MFNTYQQLQKREELANAGLESVAEDLAWRVAVAWYDVQRQQQQLRVLRQSVAMSEERLRLVEMKYEVGENSKRELLPAKVDLNSDRSAALRQEAMLRNAKAALNLLLARDPAADFSVPDTVVLDESFDENLLRQEALANNRRLRSAQIARQLAGLGMDQARAGYYPRLGLSLGYNIAGSSAEASFISSSTTNGLTYGATASLNLFDGFNTSRQTENAQIAIEAAEVEYQDAERAVASQLAQAFTTWRSRLELVKLERENVGIAEQSLEIAQERFNVGTVIALELRQAQTSVTEARWRLLAAQYDAYLSQVDLLRLSGRLK